MDIIIHRRREDELALSARRDPARAVRGGALYSEFLRCLELQTVQKAWHVFGSFYIATLSPVHCLLLQVSRQIMYAYISHDNYRGKFFFQKDTAAADADE